jgi:hypothetical protein
MDLSLQTHVDLVIQDGRNRNNGSEIKALIPMLAKRVAQASNEGLKDVVFWRGKWFCYRDAKDMLKSLRAKARQQKATTSADFHARK